MSRNRKCKVRVPTLVHHKSSGRARVRINGSDNYCGPWGDNGEPSDEAQATYRRLIAEWLDSGDAPQTRHSGSSAADGPLSLSINELILAYCRHAESYYLKNGEPTSELRMVKDALRVVKELYGMLPVAVFGPLKLKAVREEMILRDWTRGQINKQVGRIKRYFRWGLRMNLSRRKFTVLSRPSPGCGRGGLRPASPNLCCPLTNTLST